MEQQERSDIQEFKTLLGELIQEVFQDPKDFKHFQEPPPLLPQFNFSPLYKKHTDRPYFNRKRSESYQHESQLQRLQEPPNPSNPSTSLFRDYGTDVSTTQTDSKHEICETPN
jgi:hypothetical protein